MKFSVLKVTGQTVSPNQSVLGYSGEHDFIPGSLFAPAIYALFEHDASHCQFRCRIFSSYGKSSAVCSSLYRLFFIAFL